MLSTKANSKEDECHRVLISVGLEREVYSYLIHNVIENIVIFKIYLGCSSQLVD